MTNLPYQTSELPSYYAIIPANVRYCKSLPPAAKLLYGEITALCNKYGFCWASNSYFADLYESDERSVTRWVSLLKENDFIKVEILIEGTQRKRKIWITDGVQKIFTSSQNCQDVPANVENCQDVTTKMSTPPDKNVRYNSTVNTTENIDIGAEAPQPPPLSSVPKRKKVKEEFVEIAPRVFLTASQQNALKTRLDTARITLQDVAVHLSDWKIGKGITGGSSDYCTIIKWVIDAVVKAKQTTSDKMPDKPNVGSQAEKVQQQMDRAEREAHDRMWMRQIEKRFADQFKIHLIVSCGKNLEFNLGDRGGIEKCEAGSSGFRERCLKYLRSLNLDTSGL